MPFIYHRIPEKMKGNVLYPLNSLKEKYSKIYEKENKKYDGRMKVKTLKIPYLDVLWNDVLHFTPIHPRKIRMELEKAGLKTKKQKWYKINAKNLEPKKTVIYLHKSKSMTKDNFTKFNPEEISKYKEIPIRTKKYYKEQIKSGKAPLMFVFVPHILYKGTLNIKDAKIIEA